MRRVINKRKACIYLLLLTIIFILIAIRQNTEIKTEFDEPKYIAVRMNQLHKGE